MYISETMLYRYYLEHVHGLLWYYNTTMRSISMYGSDQVYKTKLVYIHQYCYHNMDGCAISYTVYILMHTL